MATPQDVIAANQRFYDRIAEVYDQADSRRGDEADHAWLDGLLRQLVDRAARSTGVDRQDIALLDAGAGSGFLGIRAAPLVGRICLLDLSQAMLDRIDLPDAERVVGDCADMPLDDASFQLVAAFATLHHLYDPAAFFAEAFRVLAPGGILYTDHDIEARFVRRFRIPLKLYRAAFDHGRSYLRLCPQVTEEDYLLSEYHGDDGLDATVLAGQLRAAGFEAIEATCHWEGMGAPASLLDKVHLQQRMTRRGRAPVVRLVAQKPQ